MCVSFSFTAQFFLYTNYSYSFKLVVSIFCILLSLANLWKIICIPSNLFQLHFPSLSFFRTVTLFYISLKFPFCLPCNWCNFVWLFLQTFYTVTFISVSFCQHLTGYFFCYSIFVIILKLWFFLSTPFFLCFLHFLHFRLLFPPQISPLMCALTLFLFYFLLLGHVWSFFLNIFGQGFAFHVCSN